MPWARLDDQYPDHPKIVQVGPLAAWLNTCGICYCARFLTDGYIQCGQVRKLADVDNAEELAERLVSVGLWERTADGYQIHDFLVYNPSREQVLAEREAARQRMARLRAGDVRTNNGRTTHEPEQNLTGPVPTPVPTPVPVPDALTSVSARPDAADAAPAPPLSSEQVHRTESRRMWDAFGAALGYRPTAKPERGKWNRGIAELIAAGITAEHVPRLVAAYREHYGAGIECNPMAIAANLGAIQAGPGSPNGQRPEPWWEQRDDPTWRAAHPYTAAVMDATPGRAPPERADPDTPMNRSAAERSRNSGEERAP